MKCYAIYTQNAKLILSNQVPAYYHIVDMTMWQFWSNDDPLLNHFHKKTMNFLNIFPNIMTQKFSEDFVDTMECYDFLFLWTTINIDTKQL